MGTSRTTENRTVAGGIGRHVVLGFALERHQPLIPEAAEERHQLLEPLGTCPIETPGAGTTLAHQAGPFQDGQMLRDRGPGDVESRGDLTCRQFVRTDQREDLASPRIGDRSEGCFHRAIL